MDTLTEIEGRIEQVFELYEYDRESRFIILPLFSQPGEVSAVLFTDRSCPDVQRQTKLIIESLVVGDMAKAEGAESERNSLFVGISQEVTGIVFDRNSNSVFVMSRGEAVFSYEGPAAEFLALSLTKAYIRGIF